MNNWKDKIATMILVKQELMKQDVEKYTKPFSRGGSK